MCLCRGLEPGLPLGLVQLASTPPMEVCSPSSRDVLAWLTLVTEVEVLESSFFWFWVNCNLRFWVAASGLVLMLHIRHRNDDVAGGASDNSDIDSTFPPSAEDLHNF
ncbi:hypothetical protein EYF80_004055 [Liparis tanakae]|uniref:Uncharacterized protein n=1 Tax=Liparis tanakae TaxID=230148 RepID=A0A4Z2J7Z0_9TELE|nr:hypothetical protein EYF80_004055 [Liparis tanakae]